MTRDPSTPFVLSGRTNSAQDDILLDRAKIRKGHAAGVSLFFLEQAKACSTLLRHNNPLHIPLAIIRDRDEEIDTGIERREIELHIAGESRCGAAIEHLRAEEIV